MRRVGLLGLEEPAGGWGSFYDSENMRPLPEMPPLGSVRRFEAQGTPNRLGAAGLGAALRHRNAQGRRAVDRHILGLGRELMDELARRGARIWTPRADAERAGIVSFTFGAGDKLLRDRLERRGILTSARWCSGIGGMRVAFHLFNTREDLQALVAALDALRRG